jgi:SAM-dependent methyltransferase
MGISFSFAEIILHEHRYKPITGRLVTIGRQSVDFTADELERLIVEHGVTKRQNVAYHLDQDTHSKPSPRPTITQESFFAAFTDATVLSLDQSSYENADLVFDLQAELPAEYRGFADFVLDGGSLDNIFDPAAAIRNISRMLKPGGRFISMNTGGPNPSAYLKFSPDWFMDFCAINDYADCKIYVCNYPNTVGVLLNEQRLGRHFEASDNHIEIYNFNPFVTHATGEGTSFSSIERSSRFRIFAIGEKGPDSTDHRNPIQNHYRVDAEHRAICNTSTKRYLHSDRPLFHNGAAMRLSSLPALGGEPYPQQLQPVAVINQDYADRLGFAGMPAW